MLLTIANKLHNITCIIVMKLIRLCAQFGYFYLHVMDHFLNISVFFITIIDENSDSHKRCWK